MVKKIIKKYKRTKRYLVRRKKYTKPRKSSFYNKTGPKNELKYWDNHHTFGTIGIMGTENDDAMGPIIGHYGMCKSMLCGATGEHALPQMNGIIQGSGNSQRIGRKITVKNIYFALKVHDLPYSTSGTAKGVARPVTLRIVIGYLNDSITASLSGFEGTNLSRIVPMYQNSPNKPDNATLGVNNMNKIPSEFTIIHDVVQELDKGHGEQWVYQWSHACNIDVEYTSTNSTGNELDITKNGLYYYLMLSVDPDINYSFTNSGGNYGLTYPWGGLPCTVQSRVSYIDP